MRRAIPCLALAVAAAASAQTNTPAPKVPAEPKTISIQQMLVIGSSGLRLHSLAMITQHRLKGGVDESCLPGFRACSDDPANPVRSVTARLLGENFVQGKEKPNPEAVDLLVKLARDKSPDVSYSAVYYGISQIEDKSPEIVELLIDVAATNRDESLYDRIVQSLENDREQTAKILDRKLAEGDDIAIYEIYEDLVYGDAAHVSLLSVAPDLRHRLVVISGFSKSYAMTGWRVGFGIGDPRTVAAMNRLQSHSTSNVCTISQKAALAAFDCRDAVAEMRAAFAARRDALAEALSDVPGVTFALPEGAFYFLLDCRGVIDSERGAGGGWRLAEHLLETERLAVVPGEPFGAPDHLRLSFAVAEDVLREAAARLRRGIASFEG